MLPAPEMQGRNYFKIYETGYVVYVVKYVDESL